MPQIRVTDHDSGLFTVLEVAGMNQDEIKKLITKTREELKQKASNATTDAGKSQD